MSFAPFGPFHDYYELVVPGKIRGFGSFPHFLIEFRFNGPLSEFHYLSTIEARIGEKEIPTHLLYIDLDKGVVYFRPEQDAPLLISEDDHGRGLRVLAHSLDAHDGQILDEQGNPVDLKFEEAVSEPMDFVHPAEPVITLPASSLQSLSGEITIAGTHPEEGAEIHLFADDNGDGYPDVPELDPGSLAFTTVSNGQWKLEGEFLTRLGTRQLLVIAKDAADNLSAPVGTPLIEWVTELSSEEEGDCANNACTFRYTGWRLALLTN